MKRTILFSLVIVALISCGKDKDECKRDTSSLKGTYKITSIKYKATPTSPEDDLLPFMDACERDDTYTLGDNGVFTYTDAGTQCSPPTATYMNTWSLSGNTLTIDGESQNIESFDCKTLTVSISDATLGGGTTTTVFAKQ